MIRTISKNTATLLVSNVGSALLSFVLSVLIGRVLGQEGLGTYTTVMAWIFPLALIADFGIGTLITRDVAQEPSSAGAYLKTSTIFRFALSGAIMISLWFIAPFLSTEPDVVLGIRIASPLIFIQPMYGSITAIFRANQVMWHIAILNIGMLFTQVALTAWVFSTGGSIIDALIVNTLTSAGQLVAAVAVYFTSFRARLKRMSIPWRHMLSRAFPFAISAVLIALQLRIGIIMLEYFSDTTAVGEYSAASRFIEFGRLIPNALFGALFPSLASLTHHLVQMDQIFLQITKLLIAFGVAFGVMIVITAPALITLTFGDDFVDAIPVLQVGVWILLPNLVRSARTLYWYARGYEHFVNAGNAVILVLLVLSSIWLIPQYGVMGLVIATIISECIGLAILWKPFWWKAKSAYQ